MAGDDERVIGVVAAIKVCDVEGDFEDSCGKSHFGILRYSREAHRCKNSNMAHIVLIAGSPASGKSTVAKLLAMRAKKGVHIPVDSLRDMVLGGLLHPGPSWSAALVEQLRIARANAMAMAVNYANANFEVFIDDFWDPQSLLSEYESLVNRPDHLRIILHPSKATAMSRNAHRFASDAMMRAAIDQGVHAMYADYETRLPWFAQHGWTVLDNTQETPDATARRIDALLRKFFTYMRALFLGDKFEKMAILRRRYF